MLIAFILVFLNKYLKLYHENLIYKTIQKDVMFYLNWIIFYPKDFI